MEINMSHPLEGSGRDGRGGSGTEPANSIQSRDPQHSPDHSIPPSDPVLFISEADPLVPSTPHQPVKRNFLKRELGLISTTALTLNLILGSGILITPSSILRNTGSFGLSLVLWGVGGVITYAASFCYLELALLIKKSGSTYIYIKEAYSFTRSKPWMEVCGSLLGFLMAWTNVAIVEPLGLTIALLALGRYLCRPLFLDCEVPGCAVKMFALFALMILTMVNVYSVKVSAWLLTWLSSIKTLALAFIIVLGVWKLIENGSFPDDSSHPFEGSSTSISQMAVGLSSVIFAYDGWTAGVMVQEETKGTKTVKWMTFITLPIVMALYILTNMAFFSVLSYDQIRDTKAVGLLFGQVLFGKSGLVIICLIASALIFGSCHATLFGASRELFVAAREGSMPQFISGIHTTYQTPLLAVVIESFLSGLFIIIGNIDSLINIFTATSWAWYGSAIFGIIIMRLTRPHEPRPFKVLLLFPTAMTVVSLLLVILPLWQDPVPQLLGFVGVLMGAPIYLFLVMDKPYRLRPKFMDRVSTWLTSVTSKLFNTEIAAAFDSSVQN